MTPLDIPIRHRLGSKLTLLIVICITLVMLLFGIIIVLDQEYESRHDTLQQARANGSILQGTINRMLRSGQVDAINETLSEIQVDIRIGMAFIVDRSGLILYAYNQQGIGSLVENKMRSVRLSTINTTIDSELSTYSFEEVGNKFIAYIPITANTDDALKSKTNVLLIEYYLNSSLLESLKQRTPVIIGIVLILILSGFILWLYFNRLLTIRLKKIVRALNLIGQGDHVSELEVSGGDEIAIVARTIEKLSHDKIENESALNRLSLAVDQSWDSIVITDLDANIEYVNQAFTEQTGYQARDILGQNPRLLQSGNTPKSTHEAMWAALTKGKVWSGELWNKKSDGSEFYEIATISPVRDKDGNITNYLAIKKNITEQKNLLIQQEKTSKTLDGFFNQPINLNLICKFDGTIMRANSGWTETLGYRPQDLEGTKFFDLIHLDDREKTSNEMEGLAQGKTTFEFENRYRHINGEYRLLTWAAVTDITEQTIFAVGSDITEKRTAEEKIHNLAYFDNLTSLPNKAFLIAHLEKQLPQAIEQKLLGALFIIDIDRFQKINDVRGYEYGDEVLKQLTQRLSNILSENCLLSRASDDLFFALTPYKFTTREDFERFCAATAEKLLSLSATPMIIFEEEVRFTLSIGATAYPELNSEVETIIRHAEAVLHHAKNAGGNQFCLYDESISQNIQRKYQVEKELRYALQNDELRMYLQPQVNYAGQLKGVEALVRWEHPEKGIIMPGAFIPVAEESDIIIDLDNWMLIQALKFIAQNDSTGNPVNISVNLSPRHFRKVNLVSWLKAAIEEYGADANHLILEVTEGLIIENISSTIAKMNELKEMGIRFSIDDFGTGYSSLSYLKKLPVSELKIDRSFIKDLPEDKNDADLVKTIIMVAKSFGLEIVAEGVETQEQADFLNNQMDIIYQGYFYGKPAPLESFRNF